MNILIVGFQRSGTTLLRRLTQLHPQVKCIFHEHFLIKNCETKNILIDYVSKRVNIKKDNWGEKVPYYPSVRKYPILSYCQKWEEYFGDNSRIIHIIRHPYDVAFSTVKKFKNIKSIDKPITIYKNIMPVSVTEIDKLNSTFSFKYEDLLLNSDEMMFKIYKHCGLNPEFDFKKKMLDIKNQRYQKINPNRAFAYKNKEINKNYELEPVIEIINKIDGPKYEL